MCVCVCVLDVVAPPDGVQVLGGSVLLGSVAGTKPGAEGVWGSSGREGGGVLGGNLGGTGEGNWRGGGGGGGERRVRGEGEEKQEEGKWSYEVLS